MSYRILVYSGAMLAMAVAAWGVDPIDPTPCAGLMLAFTWCAYRIGLPKDGRGWEGALVGASDDALSRVR